MGDKQKQLEPNLHYKKIDMIAITCIDLLLLTLYTLFVYKTNY